MLFIFAQYPFLTDCEAIAINLFVFAKTNIERQTLTHKQTKQQLIQIDYSLTYKKCKRKHKKKRDLFTRRVFSGNFILLCITNRNDN